MIGFTCGTFDLLHAGHIAFLKEAKDNCDYLIVGLQVNPQKDRPSKNAPIQSVLERTIQLKGCKFVDEIIVYETDLDLLNYLTITDARIRFIGSDWLYRQDEIIGKPFVPMHSIKRAHNWSSSELRERVKNDNN